MNKAAAPLPKAISMDPVRVARYVVSTTCLFTFVSNCVHDFLIVLCVHALLWSELVT